MTYYVRLLGLVIGCAGFCACTGTETKAEPMVMEPVPAPRAAAVNQLIVKFRVAEFDPSSADYLERLFQDTGVRLIYVRAMSGGAHVFRLDQPLDAARLKSVLDRLGKYPDIQYVDPDRRMYHH